jgi:large subunit ribosomal protein L23
MNSERHASDIVRYPVISEKSMDYTEQGKYIFLVSPRATKADIRQAVTELYDVDVVKVNVVNLPRKPKHWGRHRYKTGKVRKAIVTLAEGQTIPQITEAV